MRRSTLLAFLIPVALHAQAPQPVASPGAAELIDQRKLDEARPLVQAMLAKDKNDANAMFLMGRIFDAEGKTSDAVDWYEKAVKRDDTNARYHLNLGNALGTEAQNASKFRQPFLARRVKSEFERAVALDPKSIDAREGLVGFYSQAPGFMGGDMEKAKAQAVEIGKLDKMRGHLQMGRLLLRQKDSTAAEKEYKGIVTDYPDSSAGYFALGSYYRNAGRYDESFAMYEHVIKAHPTEVAAHLTWAGTAAVSGKNLERGEREARYYIANAKEPGNINLSNAHWRLGMIYEKGGKKDLARAEYNEALKLWPQSQNAKKSLDALK